MINFPFSFSVMSALSAIAAIIIIGSESHNRQYEYLRKPLLIIFFLMLFRDVSNQLEWSGITAYLDPYEDFMEMLVPFLMVAVIYINSYKQSEKALMESNEDHLGLFNSIADMLFILDTKGNIIEMNRAASMKIGIDLKDAFGRNFSEFQSDEIQDNLNTSLTKAIQKGKEVTEMSLQILNDKTLPVEISFSSGHWAGQDVLFALARDISDRLQLEESLRHNEKIRAIGQLAGGIAHDFNNLLAGIMGFADVLRYKLQKDSKLYPYADNIVLSCTRSRDLISNLLAFARKGNYTVKKMSVHALILETVSLMEHSLGKNLSIETKLRAPHFIVNGDASSLQTSILNLGINAREAMPEGGLLTLETENVLIDGDATPGEAFGVFNERNIIPAGEYLKLDVRDTGTGMDEESVKSIFEPFFTTRTGRKKLGLGLAAVYGTIQAHNGHIKVTSKPGEGTTFSILLPLSETQNDQNEVIGEEESDKYEICKNLPGENVFTNKKVMVVDDEIMITGMLESSLSSFGYEAVVFNEAAEALESFKADNNDIGFIILDLMMPRMSGQEAFGRFRKIQNDIPIIIISGYSTDIRLRDILSSPKVIFLRKPFEIEELQQAIIDLSNS